MTKTTALAWKESRELRWFFISGLIVFNIFPVLESLDHGWHGQGYSSDLGEKMLVIFGGLFAIILAVAVTSRDLRGGLNTFWGSRPITVGRLLSAKYFAGILVLLAVTIVTLLAQMTAVADWFRNWCTASLFLLNTPVLVLIFSLAFLIGSLVRRAVPATMLSIAAALLVYFLPILIPPLGFASFIRMLTLSIEHHGELPFSYSSFLLTMLLLSAAAALTAGVAVRRNWRVRANTQLLCWTLGAVVLLLLATSAFQLRSNLQVERQIPLTACAATQQAGMSNAAAHLTQGYSLSLPNGDRGVFAFMCPDQQVGLALFNLSDPKGGIHTLIPPSLKLTPGPVPMVSSTGHPHRVYVLLDEGEWRSGPQWHWDRKKVTLLTVATDVPAEKAILHRLDLTHPQQVRTYREMNCMAILRNTLYLLTLNTDGAGWKVSVIDVTDPNAPKLDTASVQNLDALQPQFPTLTLGQPMNRAPALDLAICPIPDMSVRDRVGVSIQLNGPIHDSQFQLQDDLLVRSNREGLTTYRLSSEGDSFRFQELGTIKPPPLMQMLNMPWRLVVAGNRAYTIDRNLGDIVTAYDISQPEHPRRLGHYAQANRRFSDLAPLPDNRLLALGNELTILRVP